MPQFLDIHFNHIKNEYFQFEAYLCRRQNGAHITSSTRITLSTLEAVMLINLFIIATLSLLAALAKSEIDYSRNR